MDSADGTIKLIRSVRLSDKALDAVFAALDEPVEYNGPERRRHRRYRYKVQSVVVHLQQPGECTPTPYLVPAHNISAGGMAFLHGGFVHTGTKCLVQLTTLHGAWQNVAATVRRCRLVEGNVHHVGIQFEREIHIADFVAEAQSFRVLVVEDDPAADRLLTFHLEQLNAKVDHAGDGAAAVEKASKEEYDFILMDIELAVLNGFDATKQLRENGYRGLVVAVTALTEPGDRERCLKAGCDRYLPKPVAPADLVALVESLRQEPLMSDYHGNPGMQPLIEQFLSELPTKLREMEEAAAAQDWAALAMRARRLKAGGTGHGYKPIGDVAAKLETAANAPAPSADIPIILKELQDLCALSRTSARHSSRH